jgi:hypothetical protein
MAVPHLHSVTEPCRISSLLSHRHSEAALIQAKPTVSHANPPVHPPRVSFETEMSHLLDEAGAAIRRNLWTARTANYLETEQGFLVERCGAAAARAFAHELSSLRALLKALEGKSTTRGRPSGMEAAELDRLTVELRHKAVDP